MPRTYKPNRRPAPLLRDIPEQRRAGTSYIDIAAASGCDRRTIYAALDRAADRGRLDPAMIEILHPEDRDAQRRLWLRIKAAHGRGLDIPGWDAIEAVQRKKARLAARRAQAHEASQMLESMMA